MSNNTNIAIFVIDGSHDMSNNNGQADRVLRRRTKKNQQQPIIDVIVVLVALPTLTILALLLEACTRGDWLATNESRFTVLGLGIALAGACLAIAMYITSRIGGKMWSGAIPSDPSSGPHFSYYNSQQAAADMKDLPPSYDIVMGFDVLPPAYHTVVIENEKEGDYQLDDCAKFIGIRHI